MRVVIRTWRQSRCRHRVTVSVHTMGFERVVCEACGHVDVRAATQSVDDDTEVDRAVFARSVDLDGGPVSGRHTADG